MDDWQQGVVRWTKEKRLRGTCCHALFVSLCIAKSPGTRARALAAAHGEPSKQVCVDAEIDAVRALSYGCLSQQLAPSVLAGRAAVPNAAEALATGPSNHVGTFDYSAQSIRFDSNWGRRFFRSARRRCRRCQFDDERMRDNDKRMLRKTMLIGGAVSCGVIGYCVLPQAGGTSDVVGKAEPPGRQGIVAAPNPTMLNGHALVPPSYVHGSYGRAIRERRDDQRGAIEGDVSPAQSTISQSNGLRYRDVILWDER